MKNKIAKLIELVQKLPESCLDETLEFISKKIEESTEEKPVPSCPHCKGKNAKRNGHKDGKQRFLCSICKKSFGETTNTALGYSHFGEAVWKQVIRDTINGTPISITAFGCMVDKVLADGQP